jgi:hypothetical protein
LGLAIPTTSAADTLLDEFEVDATTLSSSSTSGAHDTTTSDIARDMMMKAISDRRVAMRAQAQAALLKRHAATLQAAALRNADIQELTALQINLEKERKAQEAVEDDEDTKLTSSLGLPHLPIDRTIAAGSLLSEFEVSVKSSTQQPIVDIDVQRAMLAEKRNQLRVAMRARQAASLLKAKNEASLLRAEAEAKMDAKAKQNADNMIASLEQAHVDEAKALEAQIDKEFTAATNDQSPNSSGDGVESSSLVPPAVVVKQKMLAQHQTLQLSQRNALLQRQAIVVNGHEEKRLSLLAVVDATIANGSDEATVTSARNALNDHMANRETLQSQLISELAALEQRQRNEEARIATALSLSLTSNDYMTADSLLSELSIPMSDIDDPQATSSLAISALIQRRNHVRLVQRSNAMKAHHQSIVKLNRQLSEYKIELQKWVYRASCILKLNCHNLYVSHF